ncbi:MAG: S9 family peptidase [Blastocatellia bacterium]|nr:S9 family peptidase [Blastocatellia bacterium]
MIQRNLRLSIVLPALLSLSLLIPMSGAAFKAETSNAATAWTPELSMKVKSVGAARVSPDGKRVIYTVNEAVIAADKSEYLTNIWAANADGSDAYQMTFGEKSSSNPDWSPDGKWIAFTSSRSGKNNLYLLRATGGEAEMVTDVKSGVGGFAWSPDGSAIAFTMSDPLTADEEKNNKGKDDSRWMDENVKQTHLYIVPVTKDANGKREPRQLTKGNFNVGSGLGSGGYDWSPDGKTIAFTHVKTPKANDWVSADVSLIDVASGVVKTLAATGAAEREPVYSPDGKWIALTISSDPPRWAFNETIAIVPASGGAPKSLTLSYDEQPSLLDWAADGKRIYFTEARGTMSALYAINVETNAITEIEKGKGLYAGLNLNHSRTMFGMAKQSNDEASEAYVTRADNFAPAKISNANGDLPKLPLGKMEVVRWKSNDGMEVEGILNYPVNYQAGTRVPLLLVIHGGPAGVFTQNFAAGPGLYPTATFNAHGYAVLRANPRGSSGYGKKFRHANAKDWGGGDFKDLMTGVDHVIGMGVADPERLGVMGWSYGGFMTSWTITQTKRFKAASIGAAVTNLMSFNGTADIPNFVPDYFGAQFWDNLEIYRQHSAMFNIKGVTTPSLIQHCEGDLRVPISQGYEIYNALKQQNVPVRMLVMPRQTHGPTEPKMMLKVMQTNVEWFDRYLGNKS